MSEKQEFEMPAAGIRTWIKNHVELYLSDPERARLFATTIGGGPGGARQIPVVVVAPTGPA